MHIMGIMLDTIAEPRQQMSQYAPRIITMKIDSVQLPSHPPVHAYVSFVPRP